MKRPAGKMRVREGIEFTAEAQSWVQRGQNKSMLCGQDGTKDSGDPSQVHATVAWSGHDDTRCRGIAS